MALSREVKVGAFVALGLVVAGLVVFLIGDERRAFESKVRYYVLFDDVQGLTRGAPVRMGGVDVGQVAAVGYGSDPRDNHLRVTLNIVKSETPRIRADSVATIGNKGLLGDKMIVIKVGSPGSAALAPESTIKSEAPQDLSAVADRIGALSEKADAIMTNLQKTTDTLADPALQDDIKSTVRSLGHILKDVDEGDGYLSRLLKDPVEAKKFSAAATNLQHATEELDHALGGVSAAISRVNTGPGLAHDVVYGGAPDQAVAQIGRAADELATTLEGIRKGGGLAHGVLYGDEATQQLVQDLHAITDGTRHIIDGIRAGKGTVGALMVDPSVYEDIKLLLGNVERNKALRALVRYSIEKDEKVAPARTVDPQSGRHSSGPVEETARSKAVPSAGATVGAVGRAQE